MLRSFPPAPSLDRLNRAASIRQVFRPSQLTSHLGIRRAKEQAVASMVDGPDTV
jgi:hypothetical protein